MTAVVVGRHDYGEADRIVRLLSPTHGKVAALARRARRGGRRYDGALEVGNRVQATLRRGRGELWHLVQMKLLDGRLHVRNDLVNLALLAYACELSGELARPDHAEPRLFGLLEMALVVLDAVTAPPSEAFRLGLESKALSFAGFTPSLTRCAVCGEGWDAPGTSELRYAPGAGGVVHLECHAGAPVSAAWAQAVEGARRTPLRGLVDAPLPPGPRWALADQIAWQLGRPLKSRGVLEALLPPPPTDNARMVE